MDELTTEERIKKLEDRLEQKSFMQLEYPLDKTTQDILQRHLRETLGTVLFDITWKDFVQYSSILGESLSRYDTLGAGTESVTDNGLNLETTNTLNSTSQALLRTTNVNSLLRFDRETRFRITLSKDDVSSSELTIKTIQDDLSGDYIGFRIDDASILGISATGGTETTVSIGTYIADKKDTLELHYIPGVSVTFFLKAQADDVVTSRGVITTNLPIERTGDKFIFDAEMKTTTTTQFTAVIYLWEFMQKR